MPGKFASQRYARALFELGAGAGKLDRWQEDLARVAYVVSDPEVASFLAYPKVNLKDKVGMLSKGLPGLSPEVLNLSSLLIKEGDADKLELVAQSFQKLLDAQKGIERGRLATAIPLSEADVQDLSRRVGDIIKKKVTLIGSTDPALLGGFQARVAGKLLDGSTRTALVTLKKELS